MRRRDALVWAVAVALAAGCQRAGRYQGRPPAPAGPGAAREAESPAPPTVNPRWQWVDPGSNPPKSDVRIEFVHAESQPAEWGKLPRYWNVPLLGNPGRAASLIGLSPLAAAPLAAGSPEESAIRIKVPLGLADPRPHVPASNPLTLGKWQLGRRLFSDDKILESRPGPSCAGCHLPDQGYADERRVHESGYNTPTLVNCVYNRHQFWDGRVTLLEEVIQRTLDDEAEPTRPEPFRHVWHGVVHRLYNDVGYSEQFEKVFGTPPTQDTVGRALATYLRTLLAANSVHDRARRVQTEARSPDLEADHYKTVLDKDPGARKELGRAGKKTADVARELHRGYRLFFNLDRDRTTNCFTCHSGSNFTDGRFHNLGVGDTSFEPGKEQGRFAHVPIGEKNRYLIAAYKTPTLRGLLRTAPYFHNGEQSSLAEVVRFHARGGAYNFYLDPEMRDPKDPDRRRVLDLKDADVEAIVLFLHALNGDPVDPSVR